MWFFALSAPHVCEDGGSLISMARFLVRRSADRGMGTQHSIRRPQSESECMQNWIKYPKIILEEKSEFIKVLEKRIKKK